MEWVDLLLSSHRSYDYEAKWYGGGIYDSYYRESNPNSLLIVCSFNIAFLAVFLWLLPIQKSTSFLLASAAATGLLLSLAHYNANIYFFMYLLYLVMTVYVVFREELCQEMCDFFHKAEHKANLYTFVGIMMAYLVFLFYFANIVAAIIVCVSLVATYFIVEIKVSSNFTTKVAMKKLELAALQAEINRSSPQFDVLREQVRTLTERRNDLDNKIHGQVDTISANTEKLDRIRDCEAIVTRLTSEKGALTSEKGALEADKASLTATKRTLENDKASLTAAKRAVEEENAQLSSDIRVLSSQRDTIRKEIGNMRDLREERDRYRAEAQQYVAANDRIVNLKAEVRSLTEERDRYRAEAQQYVAANDRIVKLKAEVRSLTEEKDRYRAEAQQYVAANDRIVALKEERDRYRDEARQYVAANDRIVALIEERDRYRDEVQALELRLRRH